MKKMIAVLAVGLAGIVAQAAETPAAGSCEAKAVDLSVGAVRTVQLVKEYDPDWGEFSNYGAFCFKVSLRKGQAYTVYTEGGNAASIWVDIYPREATDKEWEAGITEPAAGFYDSAEQGGRYLQWMYASDWDSSDPNSWTYYIYLSGDVGEHTTIHFASGTLSFLPLGVADNPENITMKDTEQPISRKFTEENAYYFNTTLTAGRKYLVRTSGGTPEKPFKLAVSAFAGFNVEPDPDHGDANNEAIVIYPLETGSYKIVVTGGTEGNSFGLTYGSVPQRAIDKHPFADLENGIPAKFRPGREVAEKEFYDDIIDEELFRVNAAKGERWVFDATGADRPIEMRLYDAKGKILSTNGSIGDDSHDARIAWDIATAGKYYVGVCDPALKQTNSVVCAETTILARAVKAEEDDPVALSPLPGKATDDPLVAGSVAGPFGLDEYRWSRTFVIGGRKDIVYAIKTAFADEGAKTALGLRAELFQRSSSGRETQIELTSDWISPGNEFNFSVRANGTYYLRISVRQGQGLDYPDFNVYALAYSSKGEDLGILQVNTLGADDATWTLDSESVKYPGGASLLLAGTHKVKFSKVSGMSAPADVSVKVAPGTEPTVVTGIYTDTADPADDYTSGSATIGGKKITYKPVVWSLKNTDTEYGRTLWENDVADNFSFDGKDGNFYEFALSGITGDAVFSITNATPVDGNGGVFAENVTAVSKLILPKMSSKYILVVKHADADHPVGGSYRITGKYATVGAIKFGSTSVKAKENAASVKLTVKRTAKDGRVRVKYATVAGTAQPGKDYYAQSGILEWADKDSKDKTVEIRLIPDLTPTYEGADKQFTVKLEAVPEEERAADEYEAAFTVDKNGEILNVATVTLTEATKAVPGTIQVADSATPKKPVYNVRAGAGAKVTVPFTRTVGADGIVGVKVETVKGKALPDVDYVAQTEQLVWGEGESDVKSVTVDLKASSDNVASKAFTLKLTALTSQKNDEVQFSKPTLAASTVTINILNDRFAQTVSDFAKALPKTGGVAIKEGKTGTWFVMDDGSLKNIGTPSKLTFTLTGPSVFKYTVDGITYTKEIKSVGKTETVEIEGDGDTVVTYEYLYNGGEYETILQTVKYGYVTAIADATATGLKVSAGKLPDGLKLEQDKGTTKQPGTMKWFVRGVPTKAGYYYAEIQDKAKDPVTNLAFCVREAGTAVGTFNGILTEDGSALTNGFPSVGTVQLTATSAGKLTAKVTLAGTSYSFSGTGFDTVDDAKADVRKLTAAFELTKKIGTATYTNFLNVSVLDAAVTNLTALGSVSNRVELTMAIPDTNNKGAQEDIRYIADLYRDNTKSAEYLAAFAAVEGYYTAALPILNPEWGKPQGNGYLTFTVDAKGKCKTAGKLADGTSVSSSLVPALIGDLANPDSCELIVPVYQAKKPAVFGGLIRIALADCGDDGLVPVVDSSVSLRWASDDGTKTYDGTGWNYELAPSGGWYDKVVNLQTYYLTSTFAFDAGYSDDLPVELLADGYTFVSSTMPTDGAVDLAGDSPTVAKQSLVKQIDPLTGKTTSLYDWEKCINPSGVTISFKRATGIISGKFDVWSEGGDSKGNTVQKKISGFKHEGVLLLSRDACAPISSEVWTAGYFLTPNVKSPETGKSFPESYQFNIIREDHGDIDWWDQDQGWNPAWGEEPAE